MKESESIELVHPALDVGCANTAASFLVPGAALKSQPPQHIQVTSACRIVGSCLVPGAVLAPRVLQHAQVTVLSGPVADMGFVPRASIVFSPPQDFQVSAVGCIITCRLIPWAALAPSPLQAFQATVRSSPSARVFIPSAPLAPQPLQGLQVTATGYPYTSPRIKSGILSSGTSLQ